MTSKRIKKFLAQRFTSRDMIELQGDVMDLVAEVAPNGPGKLTKADVEKMADELRDNLLAGHWVEGFPHDEAERIAKEMAERIGLSVEE